MRHTNRARNPLTRIGIDEPAAALAGEEHTMTNIPKPEGLALGTEPQGIPAPDEPITDPGPLSQQAAPDSPTLSDQAAPAPDSPMQSSDPASDAEPTTDSPTVSDEAALAGD
jgi:hypothetical protein